MIDTKTPRFPPLTGSTHPKIPTKLGEDLKLIKVTDSEVADSTFCSYPYSDATYLLRRRSIRVTPTISSLQTTFTALGKREWMEVIDGIYHRFGELVFDWGLHGANREPRFLQSALSGRKFIIRNLGETTSLSLIKRLHFYMCSHFAGARTCTLISAESIGKFRSSSVCIKWQVHKKSHPISEETRLLISSLKLGHFDPTSPAEKKVTFHYAKFDEKEIAALISAHLSDYYKELKVAETIEQKLLAAASFFKKYSWTHPFHDGSGRVNIMLLQKHLTESGLHPVILNRPYRLATISAGAQVAYLKKGLKKWEEQKIIADKEDYDKFCGKSKLF